MERVGTDTVLHNCEQRKQSNIHLHLYHLDVADNVGALFKTRHFETRKLCQHHAF